MDKGNITTNAVKGSFRHPIPLADGAKQYIEGKTDIKLGKESCTGEIQFKVTSSAIPLQDDEAYEEMVEATKEAVEIYLKKYRADLVEADKRVGRGQLNMFAVLPGKALKAVKASKPAARKKTVAAGVGGNVAAEV